jgi:hypothetical protein
MIWRILYQEDNKMTNTTKAPKPGDTIKLERGTFTVVKVYPFGTADVTDGQRFFRVTGLGWLAAR